MVRDSWSCALTGTRSRLRGRLAAERLQRPFEQVWCRRRDSNSHSFCHYPLKIACLPISPRRRLTKTRPEGHEDEPPGQHEILTRRRTPARSAAFAATPAWMRRVRAAKLPVADDYLGIAPAPDAAAAGVTGATVAEAGAADG